MSRLFFFFFIILFTGCHNPKLIEQDSLTKLLEFNQKVSSKTAQALTQDIYTHAKFLQKDYELIKPPSFHNLLVNMGIKKRGLCWHFTYDLLEHLKKQNYKEYDFYVVGANIDEYWSEHNSLLITCQGCESQKGVIIDLWRNSGEVFFIPYMDKDSYKWSFRGGKR